MSGTVKKWVDEKGFGFIQPHGADKDVFVHHTGIAGDGRRKTLYVGDEVEFETEASPKGPRAVNVRSVNTRT
jgi:CspA family cold shock protein